MASVYRKSYTGPIPADVQRVVKDGRPHVRVAGPDGRKRTLPLTATGRMKLPTAVWYIEYTDAAGQRQCVRGFRDKGATERKAADLERDADRERAGIADPYRGHRRTPLVDHLEDYRVYLEGKRRSDDHVRQTVREAEEVLLGTGSVLWDDLSADAVVAYLAERRDGNAELPDGTVKGYAKAGEALGVSLDTIHRWKRAGAPIRPRQPIELRAVALWREQRGSGVSVSTANHYLQSAKAFAAWMVRHKRVADNPLSHLSADNCETDRRHRRRALSQAELERLVRAAASGPAAEGVSGPDRATLYVLASYTGLRASELVSLTAGSFDLTAEPPTVTVEAASAKNRRRDTLPLHPLAVDHVRPLLDREGAILPLGSAAMVRADLAAAGIPYADDAGRVFDFHALRGQFITNLARAGVPLATAQKLARHSDPKLTSNVYTHLSVHDEAGAVGSLPSFSTDPKPQRLQATGTDGARSEKRPDDPRELACQLAYRPVSAGPDRSTDVHQSAEADGSDDERNSLGMADLPRKGGRRVGAGVLGLEPRITEPESVVLPLHYTPVRQAHAVSGGARLAPPVYSGCGTRQARSCSAMAGVVGHLVRGSALHPSGVPCHGGGDACGGNG